MPAAPGGFVCSDRGESANGDNLSPVDTQQIEPLLPSQTRFGFERTTMHHLGNLERDRLGSIGCR
jgi:hypothetical protein